MKVSKITFAMIIIAINIALLIAIVSTDIGVKSSTTLYYINDSDRHTADYILGNTYAIHDENLRMVDTSMTPSMIPTIQPGQNVLVSNNVSNINLGDIVIYKYDENFAAFPTSYNLIIHRIIFINETHFIAMGDNNSIDDGLYPRSALKSVVVAILF